MIIIDKIVSPRSVIDDCKPAHFLQTAYWHVFINLSLVSYTTVCSYQSLKENCINATELPFNTLQNFVCCLVDLSFVLANFLWLNETSKKNRPLFKRIIAQYAMKFHAHFWANFHQKITGTKNEICAFRLHYFCTILYIFQSAYSVSKYSWPLDRQCDPPYENKFYRSWQFGWNHVSNRFPKGFLRVSKEFTKGFERVSKGFQMTETRFLKGFQRVSKSWNLVSKGFQKGF